jgi:hypothetical protein
VRGDGDDDTPSGTEVRFVIYLVGVDSTKTHDYFSSSKNRSNIPIDNGSSFKALDNNKTG